MQYCFYCMINIRLFLDARLIFFSSLSRCDSLAFNFFFFSFRSLSVSVFSGFSGVAVAGCAGDKVCSSTLKNVNSQISDTLTHVISGNQCEYGMTCIMNDGGKTTTTQ